MAANGNGVRYDASRNRWLPDGLPTPDGLAYIYTDYANGAAIHRVELDSGVDRVIVPGSWEPVGFVGNRLYLAEAQPTEPSPIEGAGYAIGRLAQADALGGQPTFVSQQGGPWWLSRLGAWTLDRADGLRYAPDRVLRLDLATGALEPWLTGVPTVVVIGFDASGHPFVTDQQDPLRVLLLIDRQTAHEVYRGTHEAGWPEPPFYVDGERVWFSGFSVKEPTLEAPAWLYQPSTGLRPSMVVPGAQVSVAGPCL